MAYAAETRAHRARDNLFYVFIGLETDPPLCYVIPSRVVADVIHLSHAVWLATPVKAAGHQDTDVRRLLPDFKRLAVTGCESGWIGQYRGAWDLLEESA